MVPGLVASFLLCFTTSFDEFLLAFFLSGTQPTLPIYIYGMIRIGVTPEVNAISALMLLISFVYVVTSLLADVMYALIDPRIRLAG